MSRTRLSGVLISPRAESAAVISIEQPTPWPSRQRISAGKLVVRVATNEARASRPSPISITGCRPNFSEANPAGRLTTRRAPPNAAMRSPTIAALAPSVVA